MAPPSFAELGEKAAGLFTSGFNYGTYTVDAKTETKSGVKFNLNATSDHETKKFDGWLETEYKWKDYGVTFNEKWVTDNTLTTNVTVKDQLLKGLKLSFQGEFVPQTGKKTGKILTEYKHGKHVHTSLDLDLAGPTITTATVLGYKGWLAGAQLVFDASKDAKSVLSGKHFALGYSKDDLTLHWAVENNTEFTSSAYHKVSKNVRAGCQVGWTYGTNETSFALAAKYYPDKDSTVKAKLNNATQLGLSYQHKIRDGATVTLSTLIDGKNFSQGGHKIGLGLEFEA